MRRKGCTENHNGTQLLCSPQKTHFFHFTYFIIQITKMYHVFLKPVDGPNENDVLLGRGGKINNHPGNQQFRSIIEEYKERYNFATSKATKALISREVINRIAAMNPPGRFISRNDAGTGMWYEERKENALKKTSQALREGAPRYKAKIIRNRQRSPTACNSQSGPSVAPKVQQNQIVVPNRSKTTQLKSKAALYSDKVVQNQGFPSDHQSVSDTTRENIDVIKELNSLPVAHYTSNNQEESGGVNEFGKKPLYRRTSTLTMLAASIQPISLSKGFRHRKHSLMMAENFFADTSFD